MVDSFISKHAIKIQLGVAVAVLISIVMFTFQAAAYINQVTNNESDILMLDSRTKNVPLMEQSITNIEEDVDEMSQDIKTLLQNLH